MDEKNKDMIASIKNEVAEFSLEKVFPELVKNLSESIIPEVVNESMGVLICQILGAVSPRLYNIGVAYKQKRWERNIENSIQMLLKKQEEIDDDLHKLMQNKEYNDALNEMLLDNIIDEIQPKFVEYNVNGYIHFVKSDNRSEDIALMFFRTIAQLNELDIRILKSYADFNQIETIPDIMKQLNISDDQIRFLKEKLERLGMLENINDDIESKNLDLINDYFNDLYRDVRKSKPKGVKPPKLKRESRYTRYKISKLGLEYLNWIENH